MSVTLTANHELPIPAELCAQLGLRPGEEFELLAAQDRLVAIRKSTAQREDFHALMARLDYVRAGRRLGRTKQIGAEAFLDTNVLVYCFDPGAPAKQRARELVEEALRNGSGVISTQVAQEFLNLATRKFAHAFTGDDLRAYLESVLAPLCQVFPDTALFRLALEVKDETGYAFYDALIVAGALRAGCTRLYSEDLQEGRTIRC